MGVFDLVDQNFKITVINMLQHVKNKIDKKDLKSIISTEEGKLKEEPNGNSKT